MDNLRCKTYVLDRENVEFMFCENSINERDCVVNQKKRKKQSKTRKDVITLIVRMQFWNICHERQQKEYSSIFTEDQGFSSFFFFLNVSKSLSSNCYICM